MTDTVPRRTASRDTRRPGDRGAALHPESLMMSYGYRPELSEGAIKCPIFQTSTFAFARAEDGKAFFQLASADQMRIFRAQCTNAGAMITFEVTGGEQGAFRVLNAMRLIKLAVSLGGTESLAEHPSTMTHADVPVETQRRVGITEGMIRLSVGVEHPDDLIADLAQALEAPDRDRARPPARARSGGGRSRGARRGTVSARTRPSG